MIDSALSKARKHQLVLKISMILIVVAVFGLLSAIVLKFGAGPWRLIILWVATTLFMLNAFGLNNDASLSYLFQVYNKDRRLLTGEELRDLEEELKSDRKKLEQEPASKTAFIVFGIALVFMVFGIYRLLGVIGI